MYLEWDWCSLSLSFPSPPRVCMCVTYGHMHTCVAVCRGPRLMSGVLLSHSPYS